MKKKKLSRKEKSIIATARKIVALRKKNMPKIPMGRPEFWKARWGGIILTEQNPCGCCAYSFTFTNLFYKRPGINGWSSTFRHRRHFSDWVRNEKKWVKITPAEVREHMATLPKIHSADKKLLAKIKFDLL